MILQEAKSFWEDDQFLSLKQYLGVFFGLGTRTVEIARMDNDKTLDILSANLQAPASVIKVVNKIDTATDRMRRNAAKPFGLDRVKYYRFNVDHDLQSVELPNYKRRRNMKIDTTAHLGRFEIEKELKGCCEDYEGLAAAEPGVLGG